MSYEPKSRQALSRQEKSTPDQFEMFTPPTCEGSSNVTSSLVAACGPSQPASPDGRMTGRSGPARARVSRSQGPASSAESMIQGICGRTFFESFETRDRMSSWESRLAERLATVGSTESALIWREKATPAGRSIFRLAVSTRHTNGTDSTGQPREMWTTASARDWKDSPGMATSGPDGRVRLDQLPRQMVAHNPTPRASDGEKGGPHMAFGAGGVPLPSVMHSYSPTPTVADVQGGRKARSGERSGEPLLNGLLAAYSPTPNVPNGGRSLTKGEVQTQKARATGAKVQVNLESSMKFHFETALSGPTPNGSSAPSTAKRGAPNPVFAMWLMGFPEDWQRVTLQALIERALPRWKWPKARSTEGSS